MNNDKLLHRASRRVGYDENWALSKAIEMSSYSLCGKSKRGVVIWNPFGNNWVGGWNEPPDTFMCQEIDICEKYCGQLCVHAEQNALLKAGPHMVAPLELLHVKTVDGKAVPSGKPSCLECSKLILAVGVNIKVVWLLHVGGLQAYGAREFHEETMKNVLGKHNACLLGAGKLEVS